MANSVTIGLATTMSLNALATIENGDQTSAAIPNSGRGVVSLGFPTITSTTVTFLKQAYPASGDLPDTAFRSVVDKDGNAISYTIGSDKIVTVPELSGCAAFKLVMGSNEASTRSIEIACRGDNPVISPTEVDVNIESGATLTANQGTKTADLTNAWPMALTSAAGTSNAYGSGGAAGFLGVTPIVASQTVFGDGVTGMRAPLGNAADVVYAPAIPFWFNGTNWDRVRNNQQATLAALSARTTTLTVADQTNYNGAMAHVIINVTVMASGGLTPVINGKGNLGNAYAILTGTKIVATGTSVLKVGPGFAQIPGGSTADMLPRTWNVVVTPDDATSITYSVEGNVNE